MPRLTNHQEGTERMKPRAIRRRGAAIVASLAFAAGGVAWAGCGDDEEDAQEAAEQIQDEVNQALEDAGADSEEAQEAIDKAQEEANETIDELNEQLEDGDVDEAIQEAQEQAEQALEDAQNAQP
jgi:TolA-binding protein